jgi:peptide/nickel transport system substrate-binding protein
MMPNGKPFTLTFLVNNATSDIVSSFDSAASALTSFGIQSSLNATQGTIVTEDTEKGNFELSMALAGGPGPLYNNFDQLLGSIQNFESLGNYAGDHGIGFGPKMNVPGLGSVDVPATIERNILGQGNMTQGLTLMLEQGYIQPKS